MEMHLFNQDTTTSPFDALKRTDGTNEWWSARELMPLMGYSTWQKFMTPLNRAMQTAGNQGVDFIGRKLGLTRVSEQLELFEGGDAA